MRRNEIAFWGGEHLEKDCVTNEEKFTCVSAVRGYKVIGSTWRTWQGCVGEKTAHTMVWLHPIGGTSASAPSLDDAAAFESAAEAALATRQAVRKQDFSGVMTALSTSQQFIPVGPALTNKQLASVRSQPSPYMAGVVGAASQSPGHSARRAAHDRSSQDRVRHVLAAASAADTTMRPTGSAGLFGSSSEVLGSLASSSCGGTSYHEQVCPPAYHVAGSTPRSRSLVHLDTLPPKLAQPMLRPVTSLGAACGPAGLGPRGDEELADDEHEQLLLEMRREDMRKVVAPQPTASLKRSFSAPAPLDMADEPTRTLGTTPGGIRTLASSASCNMLKLPSPYDLRKPLRLAGLVPPEDNDSLQRANAAERRATRYGAAPVAVRLAPSPMRLSSVASRLASPLEFFATIAESTDGSGIGNRGTDGGTIIAEAGQYHPALLLPTSSSAQIAKRLPHATASATRAAAQQLVSLSPAAAVAPAAPTPHGISGSSAAYNGKYGQRPPPPSRESSLMWGSAAADRPLFMPHAAPRYARDWVATQAGVEADFKARASATRVAAGGAGHTSVQVPWVPQAAGPSLNFISGKPAPAAPRRASAAQGVPWIDSQRTPPTGMAFTGGSFR